MIRRGFTLLEVVLALGVIGVAVMTLVLLLARQLAAVPASDQVQPSEVVQEVERHLAENAPDVATTWMLQVDDAGVWTWTECCPSGRGWRVTFTPGAEAGETWVNLQDTVGGAERVWLEVRP